MRFIWLKEIYLERASELTIEAIINIAKLFCFNQGHPNVFCTFSVLNFLVIITWKLIEASSQSFSEYGNY